MQEGQSGLAWLNRVRSNSATVRQFGWNVGGLLAGNAGALGLSFITTAYLVRSLGQSGFGTFSYGQTLAMYGALAVDLGLTTFGNRAVAKDPTQAGRYLLNIGALQLALGTLLILISGLSIYIFDLGANAQLRDTVLASLLWIFPFTLNIEWFFLGRQRMGVVSAGKFIQYSSILLITYALVKDPHQPQLAALARVAGGMLSAVWLFCWVPRGIWKDQWVNFREALGYTQTAKWFWLSAVLIQVYNGLDIVILQQLRPAGEVGLYSASFRLTGFLVLGISLVNTAIFPMLAAELHQNPAGFGRLRQLHLLVAGGLAVALLAANVFLAPTIVGWVYGSQYASAVPVFRILMLAAPVLTLNGALSQPLLAAGSESSVTKQIFATALVYVILNALLIPKFGAYGAASVYVIAVSFGTAWLVPIYLRRFGVRSGQY